MGSNEMTSEHRDPGGAAGRSGGGIARDARRLVPFPVPAERATYEAAVAATRARLGDDAFAAASAAGRALPLTQATAEALEP